MAEAEAMTRYQHAPARDLLLRCIYTMGEASARPLGEQPYKSSRNRPGQHACTLTLNRKWLEVPFLEGLPKAVQALEIFPQEVWAALIKQSDRHSLTLSSQ